MRRSINRLVGSLWTIFAGLTIVAATLISVIRLMLPQIDQQRDAIEFWLSDIVDRPVEIGQVSASWRGWMPTINVADFVVFTADRGTELVRFDYATIELSPLRSLRRRSLVPRRLVVGGMRVALERDLDGHISIAGIPPSRWPVAQWLLQQQNFALRDAHITFDDQAHDGPPTEFSDVAVTITHDGTDQVITGSLRRSTASTDENYRFSLRASGDILGSQWHGDLFLDVQHADLGPVLALAGWTGNRVSSGEIDAKIWSRWENAKLQRAAINLTSTAIRLAGAKTSMITQVDATGMVFRLRDGWSFAIDRWRIDAGDGPDTPGTVAFRWRDRGDKPPLMAFRADGIDLADFAPLLPNGFKFSASKIPDLRTLDPRGTLNNVLGAFVRKDTAISRFFITASVSDLAVNESAQTPGVYGLNVELTANNRGGVMYAKEAHGLVLQRKRWFDQPVEIQRLWGGVRWAIKDNGVVLNTDLIEIRAETINFATRGSVIWRDDASPELNLFTHIDSGDLARLHLLVPHGALPPRGAKWLRNAFRSGVFEPSEFVLRGKISDFPFDHGSGIFKGVFNIVDVDFKYGAKWPIANAVAATIVVENRRVMTTVHSGRIYHAEIGGSTIEMPDLFTRERIVRVRGTTHVMPDELGQFILASPLSNTKATRYTDIEISDSFEMTLDMNLALYPGGEREVLGLVHFSGNRIHAKRQQITLEDFTGDISFTRQDWYGEGLRASFDGERVGVVLHGGLDDPNYDTEFRMTGTSDAKQLLKYIERYAPSLNTWLSHGGIDKAITGRLPWKAVLIIPEDSQDGSRVPKRLTIQSSLVGLDVDLPWPFGKSSAEQKPLMIQIETSQNGDRLTRIDFGTTVDIEIEQFKRADGTFQTRRTEILFGSAAPEFIRAPGLVARGRIDRLPLNEWLALAKAAAGSMANFPADLPINFDVEIDNLETLGQTFRNTRVTGEKNASSWHVEIAGPQARGTITIPRGAPESPLTIDLERFWLDKADATAVTTRVDPRQLPPINLTCDSLRFGKIDLGSAILVTRRTENGLLLEQLNFSQPNFELQGSGAWVLAAGVHQSRVSLTVRGKTLSGMLKSFDYDVANIEGGATEIKIEAIWGGTPSDFTLDKLHGSFDLRVDKGRILDIEPGSGRLFGLLSLQTLPRRLSLDFNDLFKKGFAFDSIEGSFELDRGNAYTNSLSMRGPSARIEISGRTGLAEKDYDQHVTVTPTLSNAFPVASALFGPAGIGVGAVIYLGQKMFKSIPQKVDKLLSRDYSITGPWEQPVIERI
ncbi:MAG: TIGR02099 family protein [Proteobacteria bacterium]|nr:MAG: TIGR02099 family protein [Pseudomonadota bacterium]